jgi:DNA-binding transcriptional ArsR family regulator
MSGLLPSTSEAEPPETTPRVVGVDDEEADRLLSALSSGTARSVYASLHDQPMTPSEVAETVDTSLQNTQYHLGKLSDADLIDVHDTRYSAKGREMKVYAPSDAPVVLFAGPSDETSSVKSVLTNLLGGVGVLGLASLLVQQVFGDGVAAPSLAGSGGADGGGTASGGDGAVEAEQTATESAGALDTADVETTTTTVEQAVDAAAAAEQAAGLPPGLLFFLGGLTVLALGVAYWYVRR